MTKSKSAHGVAVQRVVGLRRYLDKSSIPLQAILDNWMGSKRWKRYWIKAMRELKEHQKTVKALEREAQADELS